MGASERTFFDEGGYYSNTLRLIPEELVSRERLVALTELFPYAYEEKKHATLEHGLKEYKLLLMSALQAIESYSRKEFFKLDSLVGENACQIRATILCVIGRFDLIDFSELVIHLNDTLEKVEGYLSNESICKQQILLNEFLNEHHLKLYISYSELFIVLSYILSIVRNILPPNPARRIVRNESTETKKLKIISEVGSSFARDLVKHTRKLLSEISVDFVEHITSKIDLSPMVRKMVSKKYREEYSKFGHLSCLPCFWYTYVLVRFSIELGLPLVILMEQLVTDRDYQKIHEHVFSYVVENNKYVPARDASLPVNEPILIVHGSSCINESDAKSFQEWKSDFLSFDPSELILCYAASHRQYPDENLDHKVSENACPEYSLYYERATKWGCTLDDPKTFFLVHAFCDTEVTRHA